MEIPNYLRREKQTRNLALDYALGISILGLIPIFELLMPKMLVALSLILKMIWDLGRKWKFAGGQDILAIAGYIFGLLGALAMAFMAWLTMVAIGRFFPYISSFKLAAALFTLTWIVGQSTNQFYASGQIRSLGRQ